MSMLFTRFGVLHGNARFNLHTTRENVGEKQHDLMVPNVRNHDGLEQ